ncbi:glycosyltransferase family 4 protein [Nonlabens mediterrranea]|uniref:Glycosyltransferase family 4 protein n=2 Tax=Nonlabens mediterrranea TaxID=1419947 RepID=A0ABS0A849_9FLAO|nr:glycosyltransferase family 4 protein [Nonlabens mediterrranea]
MHIAYITPEYPHPKINNGGGMGTSIKNLVEALVKKSHKVTVFVYGMDRNEVFIDHNIHFHLIAHKNYTIGGFYLYRKHIECYINSNVQNIDILEAPDWTGITAFMKLSKPLIIRFHGSDTYFCHIENRKQKLKNKWFEKLGVKNAKAFIAPTNFAGEKSMELFNLPNEKLKIIHYGLELEKFQNGQPEVYERHRILNIGTLIRKKGVFELIEVFNKLIEKELESTLIFIGADSRDIQTGSNSTWELMQKTMSQKAKERIIYLGKIPYEEVQEQIKKAHVCVFPSFAETLGMVTIESMALNKAVVNTNIGWAQDLIDHGVDGFMHHPEDIDAYVATINELFENEELVHAIGQAGRQKTELKFDIHNIVNQNIEYYKSICS